MVEITLFQLNFDEAPNIGPSFGSDSSPDAQADSTPTGESAGDVEETDGGGSPVKGALLGLVLIGALVVAAKFFLGGSGEESENPDMVDLSGSAPLIGDEGGEEAAD